jgi:hypothetical protein
LQPEIDRLIVTFAEQVKLWENYQTKNKAAFGTAFGVSSVGSAWYVGGLLSLTPAAPAGWLILLAGSGAAIYVTTDYVDAGEYRQFKNSIQLELITYNR